MKATELRIGNLVFALKSSPEPIVIDNENYDISNDRDYTPIPLTEAWFEKIGFEKSSGFLGREFGDGNWVLFEKKVDNYKIVYKKNYGYKDPESYQGGVDFCLEGDGGYDDAGELNLKEKIKYVHQLQNLYFALTGEELTYNDKTN